MPKISYTTHIDDNGLPNLGVAVNSLCVVGSELPANANLKLTFGTETFDTQANENGSFVYVMNILQPINQLAALCMGAGGAWDDDASEWMQPIGEIIFKVRLWP